MKRGGGRLGQGGREGRRDGGTERASERASKSERANEQTSKRASERASESVQATSEQASERQTAISMTGKEDPERDFKVSKNGNRAEIRGQDRKVMYDKKG